MKKDNMVSVTFMLLSVTFCVCLILANILATKQIEIGFLNLTTGVLVFPISYIVNDCITEVWGFQRAKLVIWTGFALNFLFVMLAYIADLIPGAPYWQNDTGFHALFGLAPRVAFASFAAFLIGSLLNAYVMSRLRLLHGVRHFSFRAIASTVVGELADSLVFFPIALGGLVPFRNLCFMVVSQVAVKTLYEVVCLPVTIRVVRWLRDDLASQPPLPSERTLVGESVLGTEVLVIFSGGQDSTTCLYWARRHFSRVVALTFIYGQKHLQEVECARAIAEHAGVEWHSMDVSFIGQLGRNALTDTTIAMDSEKPAHTLPNTFVPGRNLFFISIAAVFARERGIYHLVTGVSQTDYSGYPDCRDSFIKSLNVTLNLGMDEQFVVHTPLMWLDKAQTWALADELGVLDIVRRDTLTCYNGVKGDGCGHCPACRLRRRGLELYMTSRQA